MRPQPLNMLSDCAESDKNTTRSPNMREMMLKIHQDTSQSQWFGPSTHMARVFSSRNSIKVRTTCLSLAHDTGSAIDVSTSSTMLASESLERA